MTIRDGGAGRGSGAWGKTGNDSAKHEGAQMEGMPGNEI